MTRRSKISQKDRNDIKRILKKLGPKRFLTIVGDEAFDWSVEAYETSPYLSGVLMKVTTRIDALRVRLTD